jgi:hypothetical protein
MIDKKAKQRIRLEEVYRYTVKNELKGVYSTRKNKLLSILTPSLRRILLTSVLIPFAMWFGSQLIENSRLKGQNEEKVHKIKIEVFNRLKGLRVLKDTCDLVTMSELYGLIHGHKGPMNYYNSFEELKTASLLSLMIEVNSIYPSLYTISQVETVRYSFRILRELEKHYFYITRFESYGPGGGSGAGTAIHHKLPSIMAEKYLSLLRKNFGEPGLWVHSLPNS